MTPAARLLFAAASATPFLLVLAVRAHSDDLEIFRLWADCLAQYGRELYTACAVHQPPNYPSVGILLSAGAWQTIRTVTGYEGATTFRLYTAAFDAINLCLFAALARVMGMRRPAVVGIVLLLTPSYIVGGAIWGQIDNAAVALCLLATLALVASWPGRPAALLAGAAILPVFVLTKQLTLFSLPFVVLLSVWTVVRWRTAGRGTSRWLVLAAALAIGEFWWLDRMFAVPESAFGSSYVYAWTAGRSPYGEVISENGFNIWMLLGRSMDASAHDPLPFFGGRLTPFGVGIGLYLLWMTVLTASIVRLGWLARSRVGGDSQLTGILLLYHGLSYLGFNVLLTGTSDRYLFGGYPFLLLALISLVGPRALIGRAPVAVGFLAACAYGGFVLSRIGPLPALLAPLARHEVQAVVHLAVLVFLAGVWIRACRSLARPLTPTR